MNEDSAREVTLLQAFETAQPASVNWSDDDRAWATRVALQESPSAAKDDDARFIARRAHHALQRLAPREPAAAKWLARRLWRWRWVVSAMLAGLLLGLLADSIGSSQRINLLAPPLWAVVAWNLVVYVLLLGHALAHLMRRQTRPGALVRLTQRVLRWGRALPGAGAASASNGSALALQSFAALWLRRSAPLSAARAAVLLHAAAASLAVGLIAGLYLRGLVLDYRVAWESTFLGADTAHAILRVLLAPAVALSGIALPDAAAFEALRSVHGSTATGASAAPWIHLYALSLLLFVVLPRTALALAGALRSRWLAGHMVLPLVDAYFQRLARQRQGDVARVLVVPYASTPDAQAALGLRALLVPVLGDALQVNMTATVAFDAASDARATLAVPADSTLVIALFALSATPEAESQGRFVRQLAAAAPPGTATVMLIDETAFALRFASAPERIVQRRDAWRVFAESLGTLPVFADLAGPDLAAAPRAVQLAIRSPVDRGAP